MYFPAEHAPALGPLSLSNCEFKEKMDRFSNGTRPFPGASESV